MRLGHVFLALAVCALLLTSPSAAGDIAQPGMPKYANNILSRFVTPTVEPGQVVGFSFNMSNPYDEVGVIMSNVTLTVGIYRYATQEKVRDVDASFSHPPLIEGAWTEVNITFGKFEYSRNATIDLDIATSSKTPHGSYFSQSTYFVRFRLSFSFLGNSTPVLLQSRGWFTDEQWDNLTSFEAGENIVNMTYMRSLGIDGLLPDSSFGLKVPIPKWPLGLLVAGCFGASFMALYYFVLDNPGKYPRLEKRFYYLRGKVGELRGKLEDRLRK